jgi:hypothetical protein
MPPCIIGTVGFDYEHGIGRGIAGSNEIVVKDDEHPFRHVVAGRLG